MEIIEGKWEMSLEDSFELALEAAGVDDMSPEVIDLFASSFGTSEPYDQAHRKLKSTLHDNYGRGCTYTGDLRLVPVPELHFYTSPVPQLGIKAKGYMVWSGDVETKSGHRPLTVFGEALKLESYTVPMVFLHGLLNDDLGRFRILGRDSSFTTWGIPGAKPVRLCENFIYELSGILKRKSVAAMLAMFGSEGKSVAPLIIGSLMGLQGVGHTEAASPGEQMWDEESVIGALEAMAYKKAEARSMFLRASPRLRGEETLEEVIRIILRESAKEG